MKRVISGVVLFVLLFLLCACKENQATPTETVHETSAGNIAVTDESVRIQYLPSEVDNSDNLPVLKWVCLTESIYGGYNRTWTESAAQDINKMLADLNASFRIQFILLSNDQYLLDSDWFHKTTALTALQDADLIFASMTPAEMQTYLAPITSYAKGNASPSLENSVAHEIIWNSTTIEGEIYGFPVMISSQQHGGWMVQTSIFTDYAISSNHFAGRFWEMDDVFTKIYAENGNLPFLYIADDGFSATQSLVGNPPAEYYPNALDPVLTKEIDIIGACFAIDYSGDTPTVANYLEMDEIISWQAALLRYTEAGYVTDNYNEAQISYSTYASSEECVVDDTTTWVPVVYAFAPSSPYGTYVSGIAANTEYMDEALELLALIAEDEDFRLHFFYGEEGRDYLIDEDGYYTILTTDGQSFSLDFLSPLSYFCDLTAAPESSNATIGTTYGSIQIVAQKSKLNTVRDSYENCKPVCNAAFDISNFDAEITAIYDILQNYYARFSKLTTEEYAQMLQDLENAGAAKIQVQLQSQLETWLEANPNWDK